MRLSRLSVHKLKLSVPQKRLLTGCPNKPPACYRNLALGSVYTTPEKFENAALFLRLGLPSILIRHANEAFGKRS